MPKELKDSEQFQKFMPKAVELRVVRQKEFVKLKLRTPDFLYTYKTSEDEADDILKNAKEIEVVDFSRAKENEEPEEKADDIKKKKKSN